MNCLKCDSDKLLQRNIKKGDITNAASYDSINTKFIESKPTALFYIQSAKINHTYNSCVDCWHNWRSE